MTWTFDLQSIITVSGIVAQAAITWWRVSSCEKEITYLRDRVDTIEDNIDSLREWRAQMKEWVHGRERKFGAT